MVVEEGSGSFRAFAPDLYYTLLGPKERQQLWHMYVNGIELIRPQTMDVRTKNNLAS